MSSGLRRPLASRLSLSRAPHDAPRSWTIISSIDRYLRLRRRHPQAHEAALWLGLRGPLTGSGIDRMLRRRATDAGVSGMHAHRFRHTFAHNWLDAGGAEGNLQTLAGWESEQMVGRYGASAKAARARRAYDEMDID